MRPPNTHCDPPEPECTFEWDGAAMPDGAALVCTVHGLLAPHEAYDAEQKVERADAYLTMLNDPEQQEDD